MAIILFSAAFLYVAYQVYGLYSIRRMLKTHKPDLHHGHWPSVSLLVPARNEEATIGACIHSLRELDYPLGKLQVLIGNDRSEDQTKTVALAASDGVSHFQVIDIQATLPGQAGKQNVLAQLAHRATGEWLVVTDADIEVKPSWLKDLFASTLPSSVMVNGPTVVVPTGGVGGVLQSLDWHYGITQFWALAAWGKPLTAVGNNMAVRRAAYQALGGYEALKFSVTEDYRLYEALAKQHTAASFRWPFQASLANRSRPIQGLSNYFHQRIRWFRGGKEGPWYGFAALAMQYVGIACVVLPLVVGLKALWPAIALKLAADGIVIAWAARRLRSLPIWVALLFPLWSLYFILSTVLLPLVALSPVQLNWKGRRL